MRNTVAKVLTGEEGWVTTEERRKSLECVVGKGGGWGWIYDGGVGVGPLLFSHITKRMKRLLLPFPPLFFKVSFKGNGE